MYLSDLLNSSEAGTLEIKGLNIDSRLVKPGDLFIALRGATVDGHDYVKQAVSNGAVAVLSERPISLPNHVKSVISPQLVKARNGLASKFYGNPSADMTCIATTGTNGKTSVTYGLASVLPSCCFLGSLGVGVLPEITTTGLTTVDGVRLQRELACFNSSNLRYAAIEVSSHAVDQNRIQGIQFDVAIFTNLTRDHLDYHGTMEAYGAAKRKLFVEHDIKCAVVNRDDSFGQTLISDCQSKDIQTITYGRHTDADIRWSDLSYSRQGIRGMWSTKVGDTTLKLNTAGEFGVGNCAAVLATLIYVGYDIEEAAYKVSQMTSPPGRLEFFKTSHSPTVVVDFAHTPDALSRVLGALKKFNPEKLICVFGCGGNRDSGKRPSMGEAASRLADYSIVTNDNPRFEEPAAIADEILTGMVSDHPMEVILDREKAIAHAIETATVNDLVLVAGKGAETYQDIQGTQTPSSDREIVQSLIEGI